MMDFSVGIVSVNAVRFKENGRLRKNGPYKTGNPNMPA